MTADASQNPQASPSSVPHRQRLIGLAIFVGKLLVLYLALIPLLISVVLMQMALPRAFFQTTPFMIASASIIAGGLIISWLAKSKTALLASLFSVAFATFAFIHTGSSSIPLVPFSVSHVSLFALIFVAPSAINFLYRNRATEPFLIVLPIYVGAWLFLMTVYELAFILWALTTAGRFDVAILGNQVLYSLEALPVKVAIMLPILLFYALGKHAYRPVFNHLRRRWSNRRPPSPASPSP